MGQAWGAADLAVSRAGAGSVAEAWANRVPTLFLPYPYHKDQHQRFNAAPLVDAGGAVLADDLIDPARNVAGAGKTLLELMASPDRRSSLRAALTRLGPADGADRIAAALCEP
jgi:UDP-N-acetylglucosamine:LPS N-acetylglucosamine transferase